MFSIIVLFTCCSCRPKLQDMQASVRQWSDTLTTPEKGIYHNSTDGGPYYILFSGFKEGEYWLMPGKGYNDSISPVILLFE